MVKSICFTLYLSVHYRFDIRLKMLSYISESVETLLGYTPHELTDMPAHLLKSLIAADEQESLQSKFRQAIKSKDIQSVSYRIRSKNNETKIVLNRFVGIVNKAGSLVAIEGELVEGDQYLNQVVVAAELKAYRDAIDMNTIASITDRKGTILYVNKKFCEISKFSTEELIGQDHRIINSGHHSKEFFTKMWATIATGKSWQGEVLNKAKDGSLYWVDSVIIPICNPQGKIIRYLSLRYVITARKESESRHRLYLQALEEMAFTVSHNFRGPICSILGLINLMINHPEKGTINDEELLHYLAKTSNSLEELIRQLSDTIYKCEEVLNLPTLMDKNGVVV